MEFGSETKQIQQKQESNRNFNVFFISYLLWWLLVTHNSYLICIHHVFSFVSQFCEQLYSNFKKNSSYPCAKHTTILLQNSRNFCNDLAYFTIFNITNCIQMTKTSLKITWIWFYNIYTRRNYLRINHQAT